MLLDSVFTSREASTEGFIINDSRRENNGYDVISDMSRMYNDCFFKHGGRMYVAVAVLWCHNVDEDRDTGDGQFVFRCWATDDPERRTRYVSMDVCEYGFPQLGHFTVRNPDGDVLGSMYLERRVARQWRLGITSDNIVTDTPFSWHERWQDDFWIGMYDMFEPEYPSLEDALELMMNQSVRSVAISREFALALHPRNNECAIMYHNVHVASVAPNMNLIMSPSFEWLADTLEENFPCLIQR